VFTAKPQFKPCINPAKTLKTKIHPIPVLMIQVNSRDNMMEYVKHSIKISKFM